VYDNKRKTIRYRFGIQYLMAIATGFALLSISPLHEKKVWEALKNIPEIVEVYPIFGEYDILLKIECPDIDSIGGVVIKKVRSIQGIMDTKTLIGTKSLTGEP
jgi:DNA-binding Lrp family transcriptional regulator